MATVYLAHDVRHGRKVALKVLLPDLAATIGAERFLREVRITAGLTHPHMLPQLDSGEAAGLLYYVTPYADGGTLRDRLKHEPQLPIETALALGTPAYMSPEQAVGERELDARSDPYSLACVTYEMLVGAAPFTGPTSQAVVARRMTETPRPMRTTRETVTLSVDAAIGRALSRIPADCFASVEDFASALTAKESAVGTGSPSRGRRLAVAAALAVAIFGALWAKQRFAPNSATTTAPRIAVLPFENLGGADDEPFAAGLTDEVTSRLAEISGLRVVSRRSAKRFKGRELSIAELGKALSADHILAGTGRTDRAAGRAGTARVTPQFIRVSDDVHVWQNRFDASLTPGDIFRVQADIARQVASNLRVALHEPERARIAKVATSDSAAYRLYQHGQFHWERRAAPSLLLASRYFRDAIARDCNFADAYALAVAWSTYLIFFALDTGFAAAAPAIASARRSTRAARLAVAVDPLSAIAHLAYARTLRLLGRSEESAAELTRTIELQPTLYAAYGDLAGKHIELGDCWIDPVHQRRI